MMCAPTSRRSPLQHIAWLAWALVMLVGCGWKLAMVWWLGEEQD